VIQLLAAAFFLPPLAYRKMCSTMTQPHVVYMNMSATGHMNPTLPVVAHLVASGCKVTYFVEDSMKTVVEGAGACWKPFRYPGSDFTGILRNPDSFEKMDSAALAEFGVLPDEFRSKVGFPFCMIMNAQMILPNLIEDLQSLDPPPCAIAYDPLLACAPVAAHALNIPAISLFTMPGPGVLNFPTTLMLSREEDDWVQKPRQWILDQYGFDVLKNGTLVGCYSQDLNLVTTVKSLYIGPSGDFQIQRYGHFPFQCVGALVDAAVPRIQNAGDGLGAPLLSGLDDHAVFDTALDLADLKSPLPLQKVREMRDAGRRIVFISLGTVVTQRMWSVPIGPGASTNDEKPEGARSITEYTGKEFCEMLYRICFQVLEQDPSIFGILSLGTNAQEIMQSLGGPSALPINLAVRETVSQLELLPLCDAFVTHGGANSMHEALSMHIPLAVVPAFGDQMLNADSVAHSGAGFSFRHPLKTLSVATLGDALQKLLSRESTNTFRLAASAIAHEIEQAGGIPAAVNAILDCAAKFAQKPCSDANVINNLPTLLHSASATAAVSPCDVTKQMHKCDAQEDHVDAQVRRAARAA